MVKQSINIEHTCVGGEVWIGQIIIEKDLSGPKDIEKDEEFRHGVAI